MGQVTIKGSVFDIYGDSTTARTYFAGRLGTSAYDGATSEDRNQSQVMATRWLDRAIWSGQKTSPSQPLEFPRTGLVDKNGNSVSSSTVPKSVEEACYELMLSLLTDPSAQDSPSSGSNEKSVRAGSVEVSFFRPTDDRATRFPTAAHELIAAFLSGGGTSSVPVATGTDQESQFDNFGLSEGLA